MATALPRQALLTRFTARHPRHLLVVHTPRTLKTRRGREQRRRREEALALGLAGASRISMLLRGSGKMGGRSRTRTCDPLLKSYRNTVFTV